MAGATDGRAERRARLNLGHLDLAAAAAISYSMNQLGYSLSSPFIVVTRNAGYILNEAMCALLPDCWAFQQLDAKFRLSWLSTDGRYIV